MVTKKTTPKNAVDDLITRAMKSSKAAKAVFDLDLNGKVTEDQIRENRSLKIKNFEEFKETLWYGSLNYTFTAFADLISLTIGHEGDIGNSPAYVSLSDAVYRVIGSFIVPASEDLGSAFALEHGAEDALRECVYKLHASGKLACRIRFIKAKNLPVTITPVYEEIKIQFGKEYSLRITAKHYRY
jgi:hypothetical protein